MRNLRARDLSLLYFMNLQKTEKFIIIELVIMATDNCDDTCGLSSPEEPVEVLVHVQEGDNITSHDEGL